MVADMSVNNFTLSVIRNRGRSKRRVKDNQRHYDMQEQRDHVQLLSKQIFSKQEQMKPFTNTNPNEVIERELRIHSTLHHENVVYLLTSFKTTANVYMVLMQFSLRDVIDKYVKIADEKCVLVMIAVWRGLRYCH
ncbi:hypothetical protein GCK72_012256 [Caenorhabditis remanei]|uniref:Protein kinase domain-containing protein n=1 Tax=Caenorhabditis remanei TaxID=31234 RepID=A0A6A5GMJ7_CAERE|nr:hypothetical protein GCK72_012256 [Caenorhabditis remanei]KAF1755806.1 hypothetical protein GCK72_012256 [Caenorhabditis remanei]